MPLTFPAGSTDNVCFELSPALDPIAGTYTFQLTDGNGEEVMSFEVGVEPPCTSVAGPGHIICAGETVQLGTGCLPAPHPVDGVEYCYAWEPADGLDHPASAMPNATPSETTTYTIYVTTSEGELIPEESVVVTVEDFVAEILPAAPSLCYREPVMLRQGSMPNACENDFVTLSVSGSYASATWSTGSTADSITVFDPGLYSVTVTSANGCEAVDEVEVEMCTATPLGITASIPQLCEDTVMLSVDTAFMSYTWSDGSGLSALQVVDTGTYSVTVEDLNGCIGVDSVTIGVCSPLVDIDIYNGFYDWASNASWSGGQMVMESGDEEFVKGAVTVANRNDTDGDGTIDYEDMNVVASQVGRNEIDLMKLEIHEPVPYVGGDMKIAILQGADRIRLWSSPTKVDSLTRNSNNEYFIDFSALSNSTVELYVEALDHSVSSNDIVVEASYKDKTDRVSATAFWVEMNMVYPNTTGSPQLISPQPSSESTCGNCLPQQNPAPNPLVVLDNCTMYSGINCRWIAKNMTRYGFGPSRSGTIPPISATLNCPNMNFPGDITNNNKWIGGRVFWEFEILPKLHQSVYTSLDLYFDITRQRKTNTRKIISGKGDFDGQLEKFPWENQEDNEQPNDDSGRSNALGQNDNTPSQNGMIYSFDPPGSNIYDLCNENVAFVVYRATFQEFVRMRINKFDTNQPMGPPNNLEGSRLSSKLNWYTVFQLIRSSNNFYKMELDTLDQSVSIPVKVSNSNSNGSVSTSILNPGIVATNGYELIFDKANRSWSVSKFDGTSYTNTQVLQESSQGFWDTQASGYEGVSISILEGSIPFVTNERYLFSTFSTQNSQGKVNGMGIVPQPFQVDSPFYITYKMIFSMLHKRIFAFLLFKSLLISALFAQSRVDTIKAEVAALQRDYNSQLRTLYQEMLAISKDTTNKHWLSATEQLHLFPFNDNLNYLLDHIDNKSYTFNGEDVVEKMPFWEAFGVIIRETGQTYPAIMNKIMLQLDQPQSAEVLVLFSNFFEGFYYWNVIKSMNNQEQATCIRVIANSIVGESQQKQNLFKIAEIIENR
ncbi:hypothetical protein [Phaeodactylibacter xiamenensis]|uniref:hypothetical protein n=1 Tax=Phaeodactylibacter xiamenensis TaxID=1524460 RepID=UPI0024A912C2|nr:hypothetical protein [Phaeodactylibacter xiamenensis]